MTGTDDKRPTPWLDADGWPDHPPTVPELHAWLTTDTDGKPAGHLRTPCSRYGYDSDECAWWAIAYACVLWDGGCDGDERDTLDDAMSRAVNDDDSVIATVGPNLYAVPLDVREHLDADLIAWRGWDPSVIHADALAALERIAPCQMTDDDGYALEWQEWGNLYADIDPPYCDAVAAVVAWADDDGAPVADTVAAIAAALDFLLSLAAPFASAVTTGALPLPGFPFPRKVVLT